MANGKKDPGPSQNFRLDEFVSKVVSDPHQPPNALLLIGYLGASSEENHVRLYFDAQLSDYIEIPQSAILYAQEVPKEQSALGGSLVWIKRDADVLHGAVGSSRLRANFLKGSIQQDYLDGLLFPFVTPLAGCPTPGTPQCPSPPVVNCPTPGTPSCPSAAAPCPTPGFHPCPTPPVNCPPYSAAAPCVTPGSPHCPPTPMHPPCPTPGTPYCPSPCGTPGSPHCPPTPYSPCVTP